MTFERRYRTVSARLFTLALIASACLVGGCASSPLFTTHLQADEPASSYTRILRAAAAVRQSGDVAAASMLYERAHQLNPEDAAPLLALGEIAASAGSAVQAARTLREALRRAPNDINARRLYGNALLAVDAPAQAAEQFRHVLGVEPQDTRTLNALGVSLDLQGEHEEAQRIYRSALALRPDHLPLRNNLALSIALTGDTREALAMLQDLADRSRGSSAPHDSLHHQQVHENILMVLALSDNVAGKPPRQRLEANPATRKPPEVRSPDRLLAMADPLRRSALASGLAPAAGVTAATPDGCNNRLDWSSIEGIVQSGAEPMTINWLDPHIPPPVDWRKM
jgi:Flp pilus assembly protein TadD